MDTTQRLQHAIAFELRLAIDYRLSKVSGQAARHLGVEIATNQLSRVATTCTLQLRPPVQRVVYRLGGTSERLPRERDEVNPLLFAGLSAGTSAVSCRGRPEQPLPPPPSQLQGIFSAMGETVTSNAVVLLHSDVPGFLVGAFDLVLLLDHSREPGSPCRVT